MEGHASPHILKRRLGQRIIAQRSSGGYDDDRDPADDQMARDSSFVHCSPGKGSFVEPYYPEPPQANGFGHSDFPFEYEDIDDPIDVNYVDDDDDSDSLPIRNGESTNSPPLQSRSMSTSRRGPSLCYVLTAILVLLFALLLGASFNPAARDFVRHNVSAPVAETMDKVPSLFHITLPVLVVPGPPVPVTERPTTQTEVVRVIDASNVEDLRNEIERLHSRIVEAKLAIGKNKDHTDKGAEDLKDLLQRLEALENKIETKAEQAAFKELKSALGETAENTKKTLKEHEPVIQATAKDAAKTAVKEWAKENSGVAIEEAKNAARQVVDDALKDYPETIKGLADLEELKKLRREFESLTEQVKLGEDGVIEKVLRKLEKSPVFTTLEDAVTSTQRLVQKLNDRAPNQAHDIAQIQQDLTKARESLTSLKGAQSSSDDKARNARAAQEKLEKEIKSFQNSVTEIDELSTRLSNLNEEYGKFKTVVEGTNATHLSTFNDAEIGRLGLEKKIQDVNAELFETKRDIMQELSKVAKEAQSHSTSSFSGGSSLLPQVQDIVERYYYGERDREVDWASDYLGGKIKDSSKPFSQFGDFVTRTPVDSILRPMTSPPRCFQLAGSGGWILFTTPRGLSPTKFVVEYPMGIYPSKETFGEKFELYGSSTGIAAANRGDLDAFVKLHEGTFEATKAGGYFSVDLVASRGTESSLNIRNAPAGASDTDGMKLEGPIYNIFRLNILSNHGAKDITCLFKIRLYGQAMTGMGWREFKDSAAF